MNFNMLFSQFKFKKLSYVGLKWAILFGLIYCDKSAELISILFTSLRLQNFLGYTHIKIFK